MSAKVTQVSAFKDNYIWILFDPIQKIAACIDPGDARVVKSFLEQSNLHLSHILITHHHWDHTNGVKPLLKHYNAEVIGPEGEAIIGITQTVTQGNVVELPQMGLRFYVINTPGHTRGHVAYYGHGMLFCGDTLFTGGCGRLFEGSARDMFESLAKLKQLPPTTRVYCAHEYTANNLRFAQLVEPRNIHIHERIQQTTELRKHSMPTVPALLELELETNPFLRTDHESVIAAAEEYSGHSLTSQPEVLAVLRHWKDNV